MSRLTSIASLDPRIDVPASSIESVVTLVWPYSSSSQECAFLLAEKDFRQRNTRGQVRVRFSGAAAKEVAAKKIGIADVVTLSLQGAKWVDKDERVRTPGRSVEADLQFANFLHLSVGRPYGEEHIRLEKPLQDRTAEVRQDAQPKTPAQAPTRNRPLVSSHLHDGHVWQSPGLSKSYRLVDETEIDPFVDEQASEAPRKRLRLSYGESTTWRYEAQSTDSQVNEDGAAVSCQSAVDVNPAQDLIQVANQDSVMTVAGADESDASTMTSEKEMMPPPLPLPNLRTSQQIAGGESASRVDPRTPKLEPVSATALPLPSPFPDETMQQPFLAISADLMLQAPDLNVPSYVDPQLALDDSIGIELGADNEVKSAQTGLEHGNDQAPLLPHAPAQPNAGSGDGKAMKQALSSLFGLSSTIETPIDESIDVESQAPMAISDIELAETAFFDAAQSLQDQEVQNGYKEQEQPESLLDIVPSITGLAQEAIALEVNVVAQEETSNGMYGVDAANALHAEPYVVDDTTNVQRSTQEQRDLRSDTEMSEPDHVRSVDAVASANDTIRGETATHLIHNLPVTKENSVPNAVKPSRAHDDTKGIEQTSTEPTASASKERRETHVNTATPTQLHEHSTNTPKAKIPSSQPDKVRARSSMARRGSSIRELFSTQVQATAPSYPPLTGLGRSLLTPTASSPSAIYASDHGQPVKGPPTIDGIIDLDRSTVREELERIHDTPQEERQSKRPKLIPQINEVDQPGLQDSALPADLTITAQAESSVAQDLSSPELGTQLPADNAASGDRDSSARHSGFWTDYGYFTPLSGINRYTNVQSHVNAGQIDVIALVVKSTEVPTQAASGPRDWFTTFRIRDLSTAPEQSILVEVFCDRKHFLPKASAGDVVLLRAFAVKSRNRASYLLSSKASAWCVWNFSSLPSTNTDTGNTVEPQAEELVQEEPPETVAGPPVEFGKEERARALTLWQQWTATA